jgi:hypothetical protein
MKDSSHIHRERVERALAFLSLTYSVEAAAFAIANKILRDKIVSDPSVYRYRREQRKTANCG